MKNYFKYYKQAYVSIIVQKDKPDEERFLINAYIPEKLSFSVYSNFQELESNLADVEIRIDEQQQIDTDYDEKLKLLGFSSEEKN